MGGNHSKRETKRCFAKARTEGRGGYLVVTFIHNHKERLLSSPSFHRSVSTYDSFRLIVYSAASPYSLSGHDVPVSISEAHATIKWHRPCRGSIMDSGGKSKRGAVKETSPDGRFVRVRIFVLGFFMCEKFSLPCCSFPNF